MLQHGRSILRTPVAEMAGSLGLTPIARISIDFKYLLGSQEHWPLLMLHFDAAKPAA
jgi:hypothetical protein